jgi:catechol 2,3-dioxygenase-like lactoylglutathione lyase family enzyme
MKRQRHFNAKVRFHHVGIVVNNISKAINKYTAALGIDREEIVVETMSYMTGGGEVEEFRYAFLPLAEGENNFLELVEPITPGPTARYLRKHGEGLFHLAFESSNITETIKRFEAAGITQAGMTPTEEPLSVFLHPKQAYGVLLQLLKKGVFDHHGQISQEILEGEKG